MAALVLSVKCKNHSNALAKAWKKFWRNNFMLDCTLSAEGRSIKAHRLILSACSPYFEMLFCEEREKHPFVVLFDVSFDTLEAVVDFAYNGETRIPAENLKTFLSLAESLQIKGLTTSTDGDNKNSCPSGIGNSPQCLSNDNQGTCEVKPEQDLQTFPVKREPLYSEFLEANSALNCVEGDEHMSENVMSNVDDGTAPVFEEQELSEWEKFERNYSSCRFVESAQVTTLQQPQQETQQQHQQQPQEEQDEHQQIHHRQEQQIDLPHEASSCLDVGEQLELRGRLRLNVKKIEGTEGEESVPTEDMVGNDRSEMNAEAEFVGKNLHPSSNSSEMNGGAELVGQDLHPSSSAAEAVAAQPVKRMAPLKQTLTLADEQLSPSSARGDMAWGTNLAHAGLRQYPCDICGITFRFHNTLKYHKRKDTGGRSFTCDVCGVFFSKVCNLKSHQRRHTGERPFKCDVCGVSFSRVSHLKSHQRRHTGERPFKCDVCGASFSRVCTLKNHLRIHTGERPFRCDICGATFTQSGALLKHQRNPPAKCTESHLLK